MKDFELILIWKILGIFFGVYVKIYVDGVFKSSLVFQPILCKPYFLKYDRSVHFRSFLVNLPFQFVSNFDYSE